MNHLSRKKNGLRLDVGCGRKWRGDVNMDLHVQPTIHDLSRTTLPVHEIPNFIVADAHHLPFKDEAFSEVVCFHLLEHVKHPYKVLEEIHRVMEKGGSLIVEVPNANELVEMNREAHIYTWNKYTLRNLLGLLFKVEDIATYGTEKFPMFKRYAPAINRILTYLFPNKPPINLRVRAYKRTSN